MKLYRGRPGYSAKGRIKRNVIHGARETDHTHRIVRRKEDDHEKHNEFITRRA